MPLTAVSLALAVAVWKRSSLATPEGALGTVRAMALILVVGSLALLDDPSARQVSAVPLPLAWRALLRLAGAGILALGPVFGIGVWTGPAMPGVLVEAATVLVWACCGCLALDRTVGQLEPSFQVSAGVLLVAPALLALPASAALLVPLGPAWHAAHVRWLLLLAAGVLATTYLLRDPAAHALGGPIRGLVGSS